MNRRQCLLFGACLLVMAPLAVAPAGAIHSIDTGVHTICKIRSAKGPHGARIIASSYWGTVLAISSDGAIEWENRLSGLVNHDLWCADLTGDGVDEVLAANADGSVYCLGPDGRLRWRFKPDDVPMFSVCALRTPSGPVVACGGFDKSFYYLSPDGKLLKKIFSGTYGTLKPWGHGPTRRPPAGQHTVNFLRPARRRGGADVLVLAATLCANAGAGSLYLFEPLASKPFREIRLRSRAPLGELRAADINGDGSDELLCGTDEFFALDLSGRALFRLPIRRNRALKNSEWFGYRVLQPDFVEADGEPAFLCLFGARVFLFRPGAVTAEAAETLACRYSFNDAWYDPIARRYLLASAQSGGSAVHILDLNRAGWRKAYETLSPPGKIAAILANTERLRKLVAEFEQPAYQKPSRRVVLLSERIPEHLAAKVQAIERQAGNPVFLRNKWMPEVEDWDRSAFPSPLYRKRRDRRKKYTLTQEQVLNALRPLLENGPGISYWGGHGNDPMMLSLQTQEKIIKMAAARGKQVVIIFPELEDHSEEFRPVLDSHLYPLAECARGGKAKIFLRSKHLFWQSVVYLPMWSRLLSGEFADVFIPSMEETSDKTMELSLAARLGLWASGVVEDWGGRCARDNPCYIRLREHSHQMLPNHFLRCLVLWASYGATYFNNFPVNQDYLSLFWDLVAKGVIYVPRRNEILSFSPVHLAMIRPDARYLDDGNNVKWTTLYDEGYERTHTFVFGRLNGSWPGAGLPSWDFSSYAAGVRDRRLNFLPPYPHGLVLITPDQSGRFSARTSRLKPLKDQLHPLYRTIMRQYTTDGRFYYSQDGARHPADAYWRKVAGDIRSLSARLPLTVSGDVAWVLAQVAPGHLRLTLIDSGYLSPRDSVATVRLQTIRPVEMRDLLDHTALHPRGEPPTVEIPVPCGSFRFIEITLPKPL